MNIDNAHSHVSGLMKSVVQSVKEMPVQTLLVAGVGAMVAFAGCLQEAHFQAGLNAADLMAYKAHIEDFVLKQDARWAADGVSAFGHAVEWIKNGVLGEKVTNSQVTQAGGIAVIAASPIISAAVSGFRRLKDCFENKGPESVSEFNLR